MTHTLEEKKLYSPCHNSWNISNATMGLGCEDVNANPYGQPCACKPRYNFSASGVCKLTKIF